MGYAGTFTIVTAWNELPGVYCKGEKLSNEMLHPRPRTARGLGRGASPTWARPYDASAPSPRHGERVGVRGLRAPLQDEWACKPNSVSYPKDSMLSQG
jgi:hypothetical protein